MHSSFAWDKEDHHTYGHDVWIKDVAHEYPKTRIYNVCTDLKCPSAKDFTEEVPDHILPGTMMEILLNNSCSNPRENGYSSFMIELHCVNYEIVAKKVMGHWVIKSYNKME